MSLAGLIIVIGSMVTVLSKLAMIGGHTSLLVTNDQNPFFQLFLMSYPLKEHNDRMKEVLLDKMKKKESSIWEVHL